MWLLRLSSVLGIALLSAACGGGGGASGASASNVSNTNQAPTAAFNAPAQALRANSQITFDASSSADSDGTIASYAWNFGDGGQGAGVTIGHTFAAAGAYIVVLTVTDNAGAISSTRQTINVSSANTAPTATFTASAINGAAPLLINFDASASLDSDGQISSYSWNFGDGNTASGATTSHTFARGTFNVQLTVTDNEGATRTMTRQVTITPGASVSGTISILASSAVDSDINDTNAPRISNDAIASAQPVTNPVTIGGYVNQPNSGTRGASQLSGDVRDFYIVALSGNETLQLSIGESNLSTNDIDLFVYDNSPTHAQVAQSIGVTATESVAITTAGTYLVEVRCVKGASNYVLSVGQSGAAALGLGANSDFVPGELVVETTNVADARTAALATLASIGIRSVRTSGSTAGSGPTLMQFDPVTTLTAMGIDAARALPTNMSTEARNKQGTLLAAKMLRQQLGVRSADPNYLRHASAVPNDPLYRLQWHLRDLSLPQAWDITTGSANVTIAVIDTGVRTDHPDLIGQLTSNGFDFISDATRARDGDGIDADPLDVGDKSVGGTSSFHGTHVTGTIVAATNNGVGVAGICWQCKVMPLRVLGVGGGTSFDLIAAIRYAARLTNSSGQLPNVRADIINMSLGGGGFSQTEQNTITEARNAGVIIIAAAGNESSAAPSYPASYAGVISVSATTITRSAASYSNFGANIDVAAPGGNSGTDINGDGVGDGVISTHADDSNAGTIKLGFSGLNGTSMASPHMAGVVALMKSVLPALTPAMLDAELASGVLTDDLGATGRDDQFGNGLINANKAVARARAIANGTNGGVAATLLATPGSLSFGPLSSTLNLDVQNVGTAALTVTQVRSDQPWLTVVASGNVGSNGLGTYLVSVNRAGLADGSYAGNLRFVSSANEVIVPILAEKRSVAPASNAGLHYVLLVNPATSMTIKAVQVTAVNGQYPFTFNDVPPGSYELIAGSDPNNDDFICEAGEACGTFRTIDSPEQIIVNGSLNGLDFASGYRGTINVAQTGSVVAPTITSAAANNAAPQGKRIRPVTASGAH